MNERIKELRYEAGILAYEEHETNCIKNGRDPSMPHANALDMTFQKFAELIVRECMKESWDEIVSDEDIAQEDDPFIRVCLNGYNQGIVDVVVRFRNHFGVKE